MDIRKFKKKPKGSYKRVKLYLSNNKYLVFIFLILFVIFIMLILYAYKFLKYGLSDYSQDWAHFGSYLGSITGLLAFAGVLYTASLSDKRAKKAEEEAKNAKEEMIKREERDQFFKLLELIQNKVINLEITELKGLSAIKKIAEDANKCLVSYIALNEAIKNNFQAEDTYESMLLINYNEFIRNHFKCTISEYLDYSKKIIEELDFDALIDISEGSENYCNYILEHRKPSFIIQYRHLKYIGNVLLKKYGYFLDSYLDSFYYLLSSINEYKNSKEYFNILKSQLSRYESLIILFCAVSDKSDFKVIHNLNGSTLFNKIYPKDYIMFKGDYTTFPDLEGVLICVLNNCLEDIEPHYIKDFDITIPHK